MTVHIGILLALVCAVATNLGFLYKHRGACEAMSVDIRRPLRSAASLLSSKWFAIGMLVALGAWTFHVAALAMAPMSVVQAVLAGGVVLLAVMADRLFGFRIGPRQWAGVILTALGLVLLTITLPSHGGANSSASLTGALAFEGGLVGVGGLLIMGPRLGGPVEHHGVMLGAASGILFGVSDVAIKAVTGLLGDDGIAGFLSPWVLVAVLASIAAFYASAKALQDGDAVPVIAMTGTAANIAGITGGIVVFGDPLPGDPLGIVANVAAFVLVIAAAWLMPAPVRAARAAAGTAAA